MSLKTTPIIADLSLLSVNAIWGATFVTMKNLVENIPFPKILFGRFLIATVCLLSLSFSKKWDRKILGSGAILGLALFGGYFFQTWGLLYTTPARSAFVTGLSAIFVPLLVYFLFRKKIDIYTISGIIIALLGLVLLTLKGENNAQQTWWGDFLTALGAFAYALQIVLVEKFSREDTFPLVTTEMAVVTIASLIFFLGSGNSNFSFSFTEWVSLGFLGIAATALAFTVQKLAQKHTSAVHAGLIFISEPVFAAFFSYFFWKERFTTATVAGCALILSGILLPQIRTLLTPEVPLLQPSDQTQVLPDTGDR
ncbi:MAG: DMT family transporter [Candidatus Atribacteria bacterium]|nr:DMT family transporter [Candidatus Atribacteria bacterium]